MYNMSWTTQGKSREFKRKLIARDGYKCAKCSSTNFLTIDHIKPRSRGGAIEDINNMQFLCVDHHTWKTYLEIPVY